MLWDQVQPGPRIPSDLPRTSRSTSGPSSFGDQDASAALANAYAVLGRRTEAEQILRDLQNRPRDKEASPYILATIYAGLGEKDKAIQFLEKASNEKSLEISWHLKADPRIDNLRADPRFQTLERRMGFPA